jgi:hypothetical protein
VGLWHNSPLAHCRPRTSSRSDCGASGPAWYRVPAKLSAHSGKEHRDTKLRAALGQIMSSTNASVRYRSGYGSIPQCRERTLSALHVEANPSTRSAHSCHSKVPPRRAAFQPQRADDTVETPGRMQKAKLLRSNLLHLVTHQKASIPAKCASTSWLGEIPRSHCKSSRFRRYYGSRMSISVARWKTFGRS